MKSRPHYHGHRERLRQRFLQHSAEALQEYELLEMLLQYSIPRRDTKPLAKSLIKRFGSLAGVFDTTYEDLLQVEGIGPRTAIQIRLVKAIMEQYMRSPLKRGRRLSSARTVVDYLKTKMAGLFDEQFRVFYLDSQNRLLKESLIQEGTPTETVVYPRRVIEEALRLKATGIILIHNHPSGSLEPSRNDIQLTERLCGIAKELGIRVLDHLIITREGYTSFFERGLLV